MALVSLSLLSTCFLTLFLTLLVLLLLLVLGLGMFTRYKLYSLQPQAV